MCSLLAGTKGLSESPEVKAKAKTMHPEALYPQSTGLGCSPPAGPPSHSFPGSFLEGKEQLQNNTDVRYKSPILFQRRKNNIL